MPWFLSSAGWLNTLCPHVPLFLIFFENYRCFVLLCVSVWDLLLRRRALPQGINLFCEVFRLAMSGGSL